MSTPTYFGVWVDHSRSNFANGWILTTNNEWGAVLISGLTVASTIAASSAWSVFSFFLHQMRCKEGRFDALFLQQQVLLRNGSSAITTVWELFMLSRVWKSHTKHAARRNFLLLFWPLFIWLVFTTAGIFVGRVATPPYEINNILLEPSNCGNAVPSTNDTSSSAALDYSVKIANDTRLASAYVDSCYNSPTGTLGCSTLPVRSLTHKETVVACPFGDDGRCRSDAMMMDSGYIDSNYHLGINSGRSNRLLYRVVNTCSVINLLGSATLVQDPVSKNEDDLIEQIFLGPLQNAGQIYSNSTYQYPTNLGTSGLGYSLQSYYTYAGDLQGSHWQPVGDLNLSNADMSIHFLSANSINYLTPVLDPLFSANGTNNYTASDNTVLYLPDRYVGILVCADQREFKNPLTNLSTGLVGWDQSLVDAESIGLSNAQLATAVRVQFAANFISTYNIVAGQGQNSLQANKKVFTNTGSPISSGLPANQWQKEVSHWFQTGLASLQYHILDFTTNSWDTGDQSGFSVSSPYGSTDPLDVALATQCTEQRVQSTNNCTNFSMVGVLVIIIVSVTIIALSMVLQEGVKRFTNRKEASDKKAEGTSRYKLRAYIADGNLNLLRLALKGGGYNGWRGEKNERPYRHEKDYQVDFLDPVKENTTSLYYNSMDTKGWSSLGVHSETRVGKDFEMNNVAAADSHQSEHAREWLLPRSGK